MMIGIHFAGDTYHGHAYYARRMAVIRCILTYARVGLLIALAAGLWLNTLAPAGYMVAPSASGWLAVTPCPETHPLAQRASSASMDHASMDHAHMSQSTLGHDHEGGSSSSANSPCAFAGVTKLATGPVEPTLVVAAIAFAMLLAVTAKPPFHIPRLVALRPPLRGPPVLV